MSMDDEYRVWIGCLGCYNGGDLVGGWFDAGEIPDDEAAWKNGSNPIPASHYAEAHEELWVMDHEGGLIDGEYGVGTARGHAELLEAVEDYESDMFRAWVKYHGLTSPNEDDLSEARDAYAGEHDSDEDFAMETADELGVVNPDAGWPNSYIDWERAARDLMFDYWEEGGHYFRA